MIKLKHYEKSIIERLRSWAKLNPGHSFAILESQSALIAASIVTSVNAPAILQLARDPKLLNHKVEINRMVINTILDMTKMAFGDYLKKYAKRQTDIWKQSLRDGLSVEEVLSMKTIVEDDHGKG